MAQFFEALFCCGLSICSSGLVWFSKSWSLCHSTPTNAAIFLDILSLNRLTRNYKYVSMSR